MVKNMAEIKKIKTFFAGEGVKFFFDNDLILSLGFGYGYYGSNFSNIELKKLPISMLREVEASSVEVAIIRETDGKFVTKESGCFKRNETNDVAPYVEIKRLPEIMSCVSSKKKEEVKMW